MMINVIATIARPRTLAEPGLLSWVAPAVVAAHPCGTGSCEAGVLVPTMAATTAGMNPSDAGTTQGPPPRGTPR